MSWRHIPNILSVMRILIVPPAVVALATAHPAKFPDAVEQATGQRPALPPRLADLFEREERLVRLPNDLAAVEDYIRGDNTRAAGTPPAAALGG